MSENMRIYEAVRSVPENAKKSFNNGSFSGTDINPMWRIKTLTELFGACGFGWYYEVLSERAETYGDTVMAIVDINLYIKVGNEWSKPIFGTGGNQLVKSTKQGVKPSDEGYKMALTDALSVACKALGIGADVYFDKDATKYTQYTQKPAEQPETPLEGVKADTQGDQYKKTEWERAKAAIGADDNAMKQIVKALRSAGLCSDKPMTDMTGQEYRDMIAAAIANYGKKGA